MITTALRILLVENLKTDAELISYQIKKIVERPHIRVVDNLEDCEYELTNFIPDVVLSDYNLPTCNGLDILSLTSSIDNSIPFIFITGTIDDDELAANTILSGATGFVLKKHMAYLSEKLEPLLKKVVFNMIQQEEVRERIRRNKIAVNQIYQYLDEIKADNNEQQMNIKKIRDNIQNLNQKDDKDAE